MSVASSQTIRALLVFTLSAFTLLACSSNDAAAPPRPTSDGGLVCPASIDDVGKACSVEGKQCPTGYACGAFSQQAQCTCTGGHFACVDATGASLKSGSDATCVSNGGGNDKRCPASESTATNASCNVTGLQCRYVGVTCPGASYPSEDVCTCEDGKLHCDVASCNPTLDASVDAAPPPQDSGIDTGSDAGGPADAPSGG